MRYYRTERDGESALVAATGDRAYDLTAVEAGIDSFAALARAAAIADVDVDDLADRRIDEAPERSLDWVRESLEQPVAPGEVWAAGVTYEISEEAREDESEVPDVYDRVYQSERPELFLKATPERTVGPGAAVGIRGDSEWDVPEPELALVLYRGDVVGFTVGNDMSSRSIEGENPLYLPQAKVYDRCCSIGPCVASTSTVANPMDLELSMAIERDDRTVYEDSTSTGRLSKTPSELVGHLGRHNPLPELTVLLTGTGLVPDDDFTLQPDDVVRIEIEDVGTLANPVTEV